MSSPIHFGRTESAKPTVIGSELNNVIRFNINNHNYEIILNHKKMVLDLYRQPAGEIIGILMKNRIPITYLSLTETRPMQWFDLTQKPMEPLRDEVKLVQRRGGGGGTPLRYIGLPREYYRLRTEITQSLFNQIIEGTRHVKAYAWGPSLFYERSDPKGDVIILEKAENFGQYYLYPSDTDVKKLIVPLPKHQMNFDEVLRYVERSYGSSAWLKSALDNENWTKVEETILYRNLFLHDDVIEVLASEMQKRTEKPVYFSRRFLREYPHFVGSKHDVGG